jgi:hypothetical protein
LKHIITKKIHKDTVYLSPQNKKYYYAKFTLEAPSQEDPLSKEEAVTFVKGLYQSGLKGLIVFKNIKI